MTAGSTTTVRRRRKAATLGAFALAGVLVAVLHAAGPAAADVVHQVRSAAGSGDPDDAGLPGRRTVDLPADADAGAPGALPARELAVVLAVAGVGTLIATRAVRSTRRRP